MKFKCIRFYHALRGRSLSLKSYRHRSSNTTSGRSTSERLSIFLKITIVVVKPRVAAVIVLRPLLIYAAV